LVSPSKLTCLLLKINVNFGFPSLSLEPLQKWLCRRPTGPPAGVHQTIRPKEEAKLAFQNLTTSKFPDSVGWLLISWKVSACFAAEMLGQKHHNALFYKPLLLPQITNRYSHQNPFNSLTWLTTSKQKRQILLHNESIGGGERIWDSCYISRSKYTKSLGNKTKITNSKILMLVNAVNILIGMEIKIYYFLKLKNQIF